MIEVFKEVFPDMKLISKVALSRKELPLEVPSKHISFLCPECSVILYLHWTIESGCTDLNCPNDCTGYFKYSYTPLELKASRKEGREVEYFLYTRKTNNNYERIKMNVIERNG